MSLRCLIVDDSPTLRRILTRMLGALGLESPVYDPALDVLK